MRIVAVLNQKGGVGKTTTAVNLGAALALRQEEVLLIDFDPQGNLTDHLGLEPGPEAPTAYDVLMAGASVAEAVLPTSTPHLSVVPSHEDLAAVELELADAKGREGRLKQALAALPPERYDWVLIDCPPALGLLSLNALAAADEVFITLQTEYFALRGLSQLDRIIDLVRREINPSLVISGILPTLVDPVTNLAREVLEEVKRVYGHRVLTTRIRKNVRLAEAPGHREHIFRYAPTSAGAADYHALAEEVLGLEAGGRAQAAAAAKPARARVPVAIPVEAPVRSAAPTPLRVKPTLPRADEAPPKIKSPPASPAAVQPPSGPPTAARPTAAPPTAAPPTAAPPKPAPPKSAPPKSAPPKPGPPTPVPAKPGAPAPEPPRSAVPSPVMRAPRPWMKPPGPGA